MGDEMGSSSLDSFPDPKHHVSNTVHRDCGIACLLVPDWSAVHVNYDVAGLAWSVDGNLGQRVLGFDTGFGKLGL